jgi:hypothetical protein
MTSANRAVAMAALDRVAAMQAKVDAAERTLRLIEAEALRNHADVSKIAEIAYLGLVELQGGET